MCIYVSMHGIVIIEIYGYNKKVNTLYTVVMSPFYILPKCAKTREPKDKHCVLWCNHISYNICNPIPLDNLKNHIALPNITLSTIQTKHLTNIGQMWPKYLPFTMFAYNTFNTPNLGNYSPYELTYGRKPRPLLNIDPNSDIKVSGTFKEYYKLLNKRIK